MALLQPRSMLQGGARAQTRGALPTSAASTPRRAVVVARSASTAETATSSEQQQSPYLAGLQYINPVWSQVATEQQFLGLLQKLVDMGKCPPSMLPQWADFYNNYKGAITGSGAPGANETLATKVCRRARASVCQRLRARAPAARRALDDDDDDRFFNLRVGRARAALRLLPPPPIICTYTNKTQHNHPTTTQQKNHTRKKTGAGDDRRRRVQPVCRPVHVPLAARAHPRCV